MHNEFPASITAADLAAIDAGVEAIDHVTAAFADTDEERDYDAARRRALLRLRAKLAAWRKNV